MSHHRLESRAAAARRSMSRRRDARLAGWRASRDGKHDSRPIRARRECCLQKKSVPHWRPRKQCSKEVANPQTVFNARKHGGEPRVVNFRLLSHQGASHENWFTDDRQLRRDRPARAASRRTDAAAPFSYRPNDRLPGVSTERDGGLGLRLLQYQLKREPDLLRGLRPAHPQRRRRACSLGRSGRQRPDHFRLRHFAAWRRSVQRHARDGDHHPRRHCTPGDARSGAHEPNSWSARSA
jgi:hypothetical protein